MYCKGCGTYIGMQDCCPICGGRDFADEPGIEFPIESTKCKLITLFYWIYFGGIGGHHFYLGNKKQAIIRLVITLICFIVFRSASLIVLVLNIIDLIKLLTNKLYDGDGYPVLQWVIKKKKR